MEKIIAECKEWIWAMEPTGLDPLRNRPKMTRIPSGYYRTFLAKIDGETKPTVTGYGSKIPTRYMVKINGRWRRVYMACFGNAGTCYIGKPGDWEWTLESVQEPNGYAGRLIALNL
jgi:hypothetical protein